MFNRPPHLAQAWGPFFVHTETSPPGSGLPLLDCLVDACIAIYSDREHPCMSEVYEGLATVVVIARYLGHGPIERTTLECPVRFRRSIRVSVTSTCERVTRFMPRSPKSDNTG
jgi:hypothetical protein